MVTMIPASAPGTLVFVISGLLTRADYETVLLPPVRETIARGEPIRILAVMDDFRGVEPGPLLEELRAVARTGSRQRSLASYFAVVTDADWIRRSIALFGWLVPGEIRVYAAARRAAAETWLATCR